jgi:cytochrome c-type biogenesis protein CcmH
VTLSSPARSRSGPRLAAIAVALVLVVAGPASAATATAAAKPQVSLTVMEQDFICATCHEPLNVAQSAQAADERAYLGSLIAQGETKSQIEAAMIGQYGPTVLALPRAQGFNLVLYILPPALLLAGIASLAVILPRWRRRARVAASDGTPPAPPPDSPGARRLDEELARYKG